MLFVPPSIPYMVPEAEAHYSTSGHTHSNPTGQLTIEYLSISEFVTSSGESKVQYIVAGYAPAGTITKEIIKPDGTMGATDHESHGVSSGDEWHQSMGYVLDPFNGDGWTMKICAPEHGLCAEQNFNISFAFLDPTPTITASAYLNATASYEKFTGSTYFGDLMSYHPSPYVDGTIENIVCHM